MPEVKWKTIKPNLVILTDNGFVESGIESPGIPVYLSVTIPARIFNEIARYEYKQTNDLDDPFRRGQSFWTGGMQRRIVTEVRILTDNIESGLFVAANFQNDPTCPFLFARLAPCELYDRVLDIFTQYSKAL
jgi:hypothetical protein